MAEEFEQAPAGVHTETPTFARIYDYLLGGKDNFRVDRAVAEELLRIAPEVRTIARDNRAFLGRVVRFLAKSGIRQFLDIGAGLPTQDNVHEVARRVAPDARVVYVDNDPTVLAHGRALLADSPRTVVIDADLRRPDELLANAELRGLVDFGQPVAVLLVGVLHYLPDLDRPFDVVARLLAAVPSGSCLAISHVVVDDRSEALGQAQELYRGFAKVSGNALRSRAEVLSFFDGLDLVAPGLVPVHEWRPQDGPVEDGPAGADSADTRGNREAGPRWVLGGVARKR